MMSTEITRDEEHTVSVGVLYFFAGGQGNLAAAVSLPTFSLCWSFFPVPSGLGLHLAGAAKTSSDSESSEVAALYSESSESAKSA